MNQQAEKAIAEMEAAIGGDDDDWCGGLDTAIRIIRRHFAGPDPLVSELREMLENEERAAAEAAGKGWGDFEIRHRQFADELRCLLAKYGHGEKP